MATRATHPDDADTWHGLLTSWLLALEAENKTVDTINSYRMAAVLFARWLRDNGHADDVRALTPELVRGWLSHLSETRSAATAKSRYVGLRIFISWCMAEGEVDADPMANVKRPAVPEKPAQMLTDDQVRDVLATCTTNSLLDIRDRAILMLFADTGLRLNAVAGITMDAVDLTERVVTVHTKGRRTITVPIGAKVARALDRYIRARRRTRNADQQWLWVSLTNGDGRLTGPGIHRMIGRRGQQAGIPGLHAHMFRHTFADAWLRAGGEEGDLMEIAGWRSRQMLARYGAARRADRARAAHRRLSPMDSL